MSGGYFGYKQNAINEFAEALQEYILKCDMKMQKTWGYEDENGNTILYRYEESEEVLNEFRKGLKILRQAYVYAQRIDWLLSDDDSDESFLKRLKRELEALNDR